MRLLSLKENGLKSQRFPYLTIR